jgi:hypothetical protein
MSSLPEQLIGVDYVNRLRNQVDVDGPVITAAVLFPDKVFHICRLF